VSSFGILKLKRMEDGGWEEDGNNAYLAQKRPSQNKLSHEDTPLNNNLESRRKQTELVSYTTRGAT
jgi:hypothetical protein